MNISKALEGKQATIRVQGRLDTTTNEEYRRNYEDIYENGLQQGTVLRIKNLKSGALPHVSSLIRGDGGAGAPGHRTGSCSADSDEYAAKPIPTVSRPTGV